MDLETIELVRKSSLFQNITPELLKTAVGGALRRSIEEDGFFFMQGDSATHAYVLLQGRVKMMQVTPNGQQITLRILTPGQTFGGVALLNPTDGYPASAQAVQNSTALAWDTDTLRELVSQDSTISLNVMQLMHGYITELQDRQSALTSEKVEQRIARTLLKLAAQSGRKVAEGVLIDIPLSRQDVAEMTGTTLFTVSRTLKDWERQEILSIGRERVVIRDPHGLVRIADDLVR
ncbi:MAG TPA: Crp/Fnr family transcriptional regulator [Anaerolineales bacterium]|jgi:CRP-like cAMP-binding protein